MALYVSRRRTRPDQIARDHYEHQGVCPQVLDACQAAGRSDDSLCMGRPQWVAYGEADNPEAAAV